MLTPRGAMLGWLTRYAARLRFPTLFAIVAVVFLVDVLVPDLIPFVDEVLLGLLTVLLGSLRSRSDATPTSAEPSGEVIDVEPLEQPTDRSKRD